MDALVRSTKWRNWLHQHNPFRTWTYVRVLVFCLGVFELINAPIFLIDSAQHADAYRMSWTIPNEVLDVPAVKVIFCVCIIFLGLVRLGYCFADLKDNAGPYVVLVACHAVESCMWYALAFFKMQAAGHASDPAPTFEWVARVLRGLVAEWRASSTALPKGKVHDLVTLLAVPLLTLVFALFGAGTTNPNFYLWFGLLRGKALKTVDQVVTFMQVPDNMKDEEELVMVLEKIGSLCVGNDTNCTEFAKSAAFWPQFKVILQSGRLSTSVGIAKYGCRAINNLARNNDENKVKLGASGACEEVPRALRAHSSDAEVAQWGCRAVGNLAFNNDNRAKQGTAGACEEVTRAMRNHPVNRKVAQWGCRAIECLAFNNVVNKAKLGTAGACEEVTNDLKIHLSYGAVAEQGCLAIQQLADNNAENKVKLRAAGAEAAVALVLACTDMSEVVKKEARNALKKL